MKEKIFNCDCGGTLKFHSMFDSDYYLVYCKTCGEKYKREYFKHDKEPIKYEE